MSLCEKCRKQLSVTVVTIDDEDWELCDECYDDVEFPGHESETQKKVELAQSFINDMCS